MSQFPLKQASAVRQVVCYHCECVTVLSPGECKTAVAPVNRKYEIVVVRVVWDFGKGSRIRHLAASISRDNNQPWKQHEPWGWKRAYRPIIFTQISMIVFVPEQCPWPQRWCLGLGQEPRPANLCIQPAPNINHYIY